MLQTPDPTPASLLVGPHGRVVLVDTQYVDRVSAVVSVTGCMWYTWGRVSV